MLNTDQFTAANKATVDTLMGMSAKAYEGFEKLTALNMQVIKASLGEAVETSLAAASVKDGQSAFAFPTSLAQPAAQRATAYGRQVYEIMSTTTAGIESLAGQQTEGLKNSFMGLLEAAGNNLPQGSSASSVDMFKTAMAAASNAFEGMQKAGRQVAEAAEANVNAMSAPPKVAGKGKRA